MRKGEYKTIGIQGSIHRKVGFLLEKMIWLFSNGRLVEIPLQRKKPE